MNNCTVLGERRANGGFVSPDRPFPRILYLCILHVVVERDDAVPPIHSVRRLEPAKKSSGTM